MGIEPATRKQLNCKDLTLQSGTKSDTSNDTSEPRNVADPPSTDKWQIARRGRHPTSRSYSLAYCSGRRDTPRCGRPLLR